jgi:hypothetical protein
MSNRHDQHDFYVAPPARVVKFAPAESWFVYRGLPSRHLCVAVCADRERAIDHAVQLARTRSSIGAASQVHVPAPAPEQWMTVWCSADAEPQYREASKMRRQA